MNMKAQMKTTKPVKLTVLLDAELERRLHDEQARIAKETGFNVSMTQVASRAMRAGFDSQQA